MNKKNRMELSYNMQLAVDYESGIILSNTVTQDPTDHHQLTPQIEQINRYIGTLTHDTALSADNGYYTKTNLQYLNDNELDGYIPNRKQAHESKKKQTKTNKPFSKHNFKYNYQKDHYLCPNNEILKYQKTYTYNNIHMRQHYTNKCLNCPNQIEYTGKDRLRVITDYGDVLSKQMALKMESKKRKNRICKTKTNSRMAIWKHKTKPQTHKILYTRNKTNNNRKQPHMHLTQHKKNKNPPNTKTKTSKIQQKYQIPKKLEKIYKKLEKFMRQPQWIKKNLNPNTISEFNSF